MKGNKQGKVNWIAAGVIGIFLIVGLVAFQMFANSKPVEQSVNGAPITANAVLQVQDTQSVGLAAYQAGLNLNSRTQLAISYVVYQGTSPKASGTLSASATTAFVGATNQRFDWAAYDDNGAGTDYYLTKRSFDAVAGAIPNDMLNWQEVTPSSDVTATFLETDGTANDGTIAIGNSSSKTVGLQLELNNLNKKFQNMFVCADYNTSMFESVSVIGNGATELAGGTPSRLSSYEKCFSLGKSLPTTDDKNTADPKVTYSISLTAKADVNPVQNVTILTGDMAYFIVPSTGLPSADLVTQDNNNNDVGAADLTSTLNVQ